jgi:hypothetical protein
VAALLREEEAEVAERGGVAGVEPDGLLVLAARLFEVARAVLEEAAVVVGRRQLGGGRRRAAARRAAVFGSGGRGQLGREIFSHLKPPQP